MSKYTSFTDAQIGQLRAWFKRFETPGKGVVNARQQMTVLKTDQRFRQLHGIKFIENEFFLKINPEIEYKVEYCWNIHVRDIEVDFPEFIRLVALFSRRLAANDDEIHAKTTAQIVQRPRDLELYLSRPDAAPNRLPFIDEYDSCIRHVISPPTGDVEDQPCYHCCGLGLCYSMVVAMACLPCFCFQVLSADFKYTQLVPKAFENEPWSFLHWAVWHGNEEAIKLLIKHGASVDVAANASLIYPCRVTPYDLAVYLRILRGGYQLSEETIRLLEPVEMRMARELLKRETTPGYQPPAAQVGVAPSAKVKDSNSGALVPRVQEDMVREDLEEPKDLREKLEGGIEDAIKDAAEDAATEAVNQALDDEDEDADEEEEEGEDEGEEEEGEEGEEILEAATGGAVSGFISGMFS